MTADSPRKPIFNVHSHEAGQRLDNYLLKQCKGLDKSKCYKLIRKGQIRVNGKRAKPLHRIQTDDQIRVPPHLFFVEREAIAIPESAKRELNQQVIHEDDDFVVLNKPAGLPVHVGSGHAFGAIEIMQAIPGYEHLQLAHRIDKDTSGCLLFSKHRQALLQFQQAIKQHQIDKTYVAVLVGQVTDQTTVDQPLDTEHRVNGIRTVVVSDSGKSAKTTFTPLQASDQFTLVRCEIEQGRTHQIRVHAQSLGHPVLGDTLYGTVAKHLPRALFLHAHELQFAQHVFTVPIPESFFNVINRHPST